MFTFAGALCVKTQHWKMKVNNSFSSWKGVQRTFFLVSYPLSCTRIVRMEECMMCLSPDIGLFQPPGGTYFYFFSTREVQSTEHIKKI